MKTKNSLLTAAVIGLAVVAGLLGVGGTWAVWNAVAPSGAGTVQSADFRVTLNDSPMTVEGIAATVSVTSTSPLTPKSPVYAKVTVANATDAGGPFQIRATMGQPSVSNASVAALASTVSVRTASAPASGDCAAATYTATPASATIAKGGSAVFCVRTSLPDSAPDTLSKATATITVPVTAAQIS